LKTVILTGKNQPGGVLTQEDLGVLLCCYYHALRRAIKAYEPGISRSHARLCAGLRTDIESPWAGDPALLVSKEPVAVARATKLSQWLVEGCHRLFDEYAVINATFDALLKESSQS